MVCGSYQAQTSNTEDAKDITRQILISERLSLLSDLRSFEEQGVNLPPLARASVESEVADAAWPIDKEWAKVLLRRAYTRTLPDEDERTKLRNRKPGMQPTVPSLVERSRSIVRGRIMRIAGREKAFAGDLARWSLEQLGPYEAQMTYTNLAADAWRDRDVERTGEYLQRAFDSDPSQIGAGFLMAEIAASDRATADKLITEYLKRLMGFPMSTARDGNVSRIFLIVHVLVFPANSSSMPGPEVMRAYVDFVLNSFWDLETREPGSIKGYRAFLLKAWVPLNQYAPTLIGRFMVLEERSRRSTDEAFRPSEASRQEAEKSKSQSATGDDTPDEGAIIKAIHRGDFAKARKLIEKLPDGLEKTQFSETVNAKEALHLLKNDDLSGATQLAERLKYASSIRAVYPSLIEKCVSEKDQVSASNLMVQAIKRLKHSDPALLISGAIRPPPSIIATSTEFDPVLDGMAQLTLAVVPISDEIAGIGLNEVITVANISQQNIDQGDPGFDISIFRKLAAKKLSETRQAAESLKSPFRRLVALAALYQWKAADLRERMTKSGLPVNVASEAR